MEKPARGPPLITACRLWKKQSGKGHTYLVGRMGGLRVLIMAKKDGEGDHTHVLLVGAAENNEKRE
jgi:hypothetical protein